MTLDQLRYFVRVAKEGHMGKAAKLLHVTASTLSQAIKGLEESLGIELFLRDGRKLVLTESGKRLVIEGSSILGAVDSLGSRLSFRRKTTLISCGGPPSLMSSLLIPTIQRLEKTLFAFDFKFAYMPSAEVHRQIIEGQLDFGILFSEKREVAEGEVLIHGDRLYACARHAHPLFKLDAKDRLASLHEFPLVSPQPMQILTSGSNPALSKILARLVRLQYVIPSYEDGMRILAENDYWGLFPGWVVKAHGDRLAKIADNELCPEVMICAATQENSPLEEELPFIFSALRSLAGG